MNNHKITTAAEAQLLLKVEGLEKVDSNYNRQTNRFDDIIEPATKLLSQRSLDSLNKYPFCQAFQPKTWTPLGNLWPVGASVEVIHETADNRRCYSEAAYCVKSPTALTADDWEILHANNCFMGGQQCGLITKTTQTADGWEYQCRSVCDSSD